MEREIINLEPDALHKLFVENRPLLNLGGNGRLAGLREEAMEHFLRLGYPTQRLEAWK